MMKMAGDEKTTRWHDVAWPMAASVAARLVLLFWIVRATGLASILAGDSMSYLKPGAELLRQGCFCSEGVWEIDRTPGYPLFAMMTGSLWGAVLLTVLAQIGLAALSVWLVRRISFELLRDARGSIAAAWLMALEPLSLEYSLRVLSETLFVVLLLVFLWLMMRSIVKPAMQKMALAAAVLAAMAYVRPVAYWLAVPVVLFLLTMRMLQSAEVAQAQRPRGHQWKAVTVFALVFLALVAPWQIRNLRVANYAGFSSIADKNLYFYEAGAVLARESHESLEAWQLQVGKDDRMRWSKLHLEQLSWTVARHVEWLRRDGLQVLRQHPWVFFETYVAGEIRLLFAPGASELFRLIGLHPPGRAGLIERQWMLPQWMVAMCMEAFLLLLYGFAARMWFALRMRKERVVRPTVLWMLAVIAVYFLAVSGGGQAVSRLRLPVMPILCIFAGEGIAQTVKSGDPGRI